MQTKTTLDTRKHFFFAEAEAGMYDVTIGLVVPHYQIMHDMVLAILHETSLATRGTVLDVGSGTGADSISILKEFPNSSVVALDLCGPIQDVHKDKLRSMGKKGVQILKRSKFIEGDVLSFVTRPEGLAQYTDGGYSAIVSSLVVHHFSHAEKMHFYRMAFNLLRPGGILINADLFSYRDKEQDRFANAYDSQWMKKHLLDSTSAIEGEAGLNREHRKRMLSRWLWHYKHSNNLEPLEDIAGASGQINMLKRAGFVSVAVPYRMALSGILVGHKKH
jgi:cyclopropane fatty-acyl-phospholipid synthase-like methyltransferase